MTAWSLWVGKVWWFAIRRFATFSDFNGVGYVYGNGRKASWSGTISEMFLIDEETERYPDTRYPPHYKFSHNRAYY